MNTKELSKRYSVLLKRYWDIKSAREGSSVKSGDKKKEEKHFSSSKRLSAITALNRTKGLDGRRMRICPCPHPLKSSEEPWRRLCCLCAALTWPHSLVSWSHTAPPHSGLKFIYLETLEPFIITRARDWSPSPLPWRIFPSMLCKTSSGSNFDTRRY